MRTAEEKRVAACEAAARWRQRHPERAKAIRRAWGERNKATEKERWRAAALRRRSPYHGLTKPQVSALLASQGGCCAICGTDQKGGPWWHCDHNHDTGRVRAVLCHQCNVGIGCFKDDPERVRKAASYLDQHNALDSLL